MTRIGLKLPLRSNGMIQFQSSMRFILVRIAGLYHKKTRQDMPQVGHKFIIVHTFPHSFTLLFTPWFKNSEEIIIKQESELRIEPRTFLVISTKGVLTLCFFFRLLCTMPECNCALFPFLSWPHDAREWWRKCFFYIAAHLEGCFGHRDT